MIICTQFEPNLKYFFNLKFPDNYRQLVTYKRALRVREWVICVLTAIFSYGNNIIWRLMSRRQRHLLSQSWPWRSAWPASWIQNSFVCILWLSCSQCYSKISYHVCSRASQRDAWTTEPLNFQWVASHPHYGHHHRFRNQISASRTRPAASVYFLPLLALRTHKSGSVLSTGERLDYGDANDSFSAPQNPKTKNNILWVALGLTWGGFAPIPEKPSSSQMWEWVLLPGRGRGAGGVGEGRRFTACRRVNTAPF